MTDKPVSIEVLDAIMGSGKTLGIINWMLSNPQYKYLYISPMLTEVENRIPTDCAALEFVFPSTDEYKTKSEHLLHLLKDGRNISFSHSLFQDLSKLHLECIQREKYILIIDEEVGMIEPYSGTYTKGDITSLENAKHIEVDEDQLGLVRWKWDTIEENTVYSKLKRQCELEQLYCAKRSREMMVIQLPMSLVQSAQRTIILTYLFKGSVMESFLKLKGMEILQFTEVKLIKDTQEVKKQARELINLKTTPSIKALSNLSLSHTWYTTNGKKEDYIRIGNAIHSLVRKYSPEDIIFTMPKEALERRTKNKKPNPRCAIHKSTNADTMFLYSAARATNDYSNRKVAIHVYNRFVNRTVMAYLQDYGSELDAVPDDDQFALAEMIQWIWRTQIREDKPIDLYIVSPRMKQLFDNWINS